jgi:periodic tryptophan protein 2
MKYSYRFSQLVGVAYRNANQLFTPDGGTLLSPVGSRVNCIDLVTHETTTLDFETRSDIARLALSPNGRLLVAVDVDGHAVCANLPRRVVVHRFNFKAPVADLAFSPDGAYLAVTHGRKLLVWRTPGLEREFSPFALHRRYTGHYDELTCVDWSPNGAYLVTGSADQTARVYTLHPQPGYIPVTLSGHRDALVSVHFAAEDVVYTVSRDGAVYVWAWQERADLTERDAMAVAVLARAQAAAAAAAQADGGALGDDDEEGDEEEEDDKDEEGEGEGEEAEEEGDDDDGSGSDDDSGDDSGDGEERHAAEGGARATRGSARAPGSYDGPRRKRPRAGDAPSSSSGGGDDGEAAALASAAVAALGVDPSGARLGRQQYSRGKSVGGITDALASRRPHPVPAPYARASGGVAADGSRAGGVRVLAITRGEWGLQRKHYFKHNAVAAAAEAAAAAATAAAGGDAAAGAAAAAAAPVPRSLSRVISACLHKPSGLFVVGFANGVFGLYTLPDGSHLHALSISQHEIHSVAINAAGTWLAFGARTLGQVLVWEWRTETYVLKQQGHFYDLNAVAYSPNGQLLATGGDDGKLKLWNAASGFCFVTFTEHTSAVTGVAFMGGRGGGGGGGGGGHGLSVVTSSLDGTVRAFDLVRYRNFRTFSAPEPVQFLCVATDDAGEVVMAGGMDPFAVYVWSVQTGKLLDVLSGHKAPVSSLAYSAGAGLLASGSWDKTVKLWDVFRTGTSTESFTHASDVTAVAFRPDGHALAAASLDGHVTFWDVRKGTLAGTIEGRRDASGGRRVDDVRTAASSAHSKCFSALAYTADGECVLAGGRSKYLCLYAVGPKLLLKKWQLSHNRSLDGVLDKLNSKGLGDGGVVLAALDVEGSADPADRAKPDLALPGVTRGAGAAQLSRRTGPELRTRALAFSPAGRAFAAACTEGLLVYSMDDSLVFDPFELGEDVTPAAARAALAAGHFARGLLLALHLNEGALIAQAAEAPPAAALPLVAAAIPLAFLSRLLELVAARLAPGPAAAATATAAAAAAASSPHLEFYLAWALALLQCHGRALRERAALFGGPMRALQRALLAHRESLCRLTERNAHALDFLCEGNSDNGVVAPSSGAAAPGALDADGDGSEGDADWSDDDDDDDDAEEDGDDDDAPLVPAAVGRYA